MNFRYFILGLLAQQPMSGYDIKRFLEHLDWLIGSPSFGSVYPALHALLKDGLVTVNAVNGGSKQSRKVYDITEMGRQTLQERINQPIEPGASLKAFLMRLMLASNLSYTGLIACLQQRRSQVAVHHAALEHIAAARVETAEWGKHLAFDFGLAAAAAELAWLNRALERLSQREPSGQSSVAVSVGGKSERQDEGFGTGTRQVTGPSFRSGGET
jgi:PadR family transcriptional regulator AphA